ncbi:MAG: hypothetical protein IPL60_01755 [Ardenticatenia bacterium]|nr:hypothetical protein [Ardenticatenia bacterium]
MGIYTEPAEGYLYFACGPGDSATCRLEWQDLLKAVGSRRCAAFGDRYLTDPKPNGRLRPADEAPANPDRYPIGQGVLMVQQGDTNTWGAAQIRSRTGNAIAHTGPANHHRGPADRSALRDTHRQAGSHHRIARGQDLPDSRALPAARRPALAPASERRHGRQRDAGSRRRHGPICEGSPPPTVVRGPT